VKQKFDKWHRWLEAIRADLRAARIQNHIYHELAKIVAGNPTLPQTSDLYWYLSVQHAQALSMAVRRQVKRNPDSISLLGLLEEIRDNVTLFTKDRALEGLDQAFAPRFLTEFGILSDSSGDHLSSAVVDSDIKELQSSAATLEGYADRVIAHLDKRQPKSWPQYQDLNKALDTLERLLYRYMFLVDRSIGGSLVAGFDDADWRRPLAFAWLPPTMSDSETSAV